MRAVVSLLLSLGILLEPQVSAKTWKNLRISGFVSNLDDDGGPPIVTEDVPSDGSPVVEVKSTINVLDLHASFPKFVKIIQQVRSEQSCDSKWISVSNIGNGRFGTVDVVHHINRPDKLYARKSLEFVQIPPDLRDLFADKQIIAPTDEPFIVSADANFLIPFSAATETAKLLLAREVIIQSRAAEIDLAPKVRDVFVCKGETTYGIVVMELLHGTTAFSFIEANGERKIQMIEGQFNVNKLALVQHEERIYNILLSARQALRRLFREKGIVHNDAHCENIFVCDNPTRGINGVMLMDFGQSFYYSNDHSFYLITMKGNRLHCPRLIPNAFIPYATNFRIAFKALFRDDPMMWIRFKHDISEPIDPWIQFVDAEGMEYAKRLNEAANAEN